MSTSSSSISEPPFDAEGKKRIPKSLEDVAAVKPDFNARWEPDAGLPMHMATVLYIITSLSHTRLEEVAYDLPTMYRRDIFKLGYTSFSRHLIDRSFAVSLAELEELAAMCPVPIYMVQNGTLSVRKLFEADRDVADEEVRRKALQATIVVLEAVLFADGWEQLKALLKMVEDNDPSFFAPWQVWMLRTRFGFGQ
ncbi:hypothetical protein CspHIS471_0106810 [Cutaneotrichosporon sp. HIS471]|nr:hypothetical protein CspHIS471_0106810 [Cutaneotrichosporon sp. HIS471]